MIGGHLVGSRTKACAAHREPQICGVNIAARRADNARQYASVASAVVDAPPPVCYGAAVAWTGSRRRFDIEVHGRRKSLDTYRLTRSTNASHTATTTLDLAPSGAKPVESFVFHPVARVTT